jgi:succinoglycan biosynthesis transport protein ExoP
MHSWHPPRLGHHEEPPHDRNVVPATDAPDWRHASTSSESEFHYYWRIFYGRRWLLAATSLIGLTIAAVYTVRQPRLYQAQATVEFKAALPPGKDLEMVKSEFVISPALVVRLLTTKVLAARVIRQAHERGTEWLGHTESAEPPAAGWRGAWDGVRAVPGKLLTAARVALGGAEPTTPNGKQTGPQLWEGVDFATINAYYGLISIRPEPMTSLADIVVTHPDPSIGATIANAHAQALVDMDLETKVTSLSDAQSVVRQQLDEVKGKLEASRKALSEYQSSHGILSLPKDNTTITREALQQLNKLLTEAQGERIVAEASYRNAAAMSPDEVAATLPEPSLKALRDELLSLKAKYAARLNEYGRHHPDMVTMRARMDALHDQLRAAGAQAREQLRAAFEAAQAKELGLRTNFGQLSKVASAEDRGLVQLLILQREVETNQELYATLLQEAKQADLNSGVFRWTSVKLVDRAVAADIPSYPRTRRNIEFGLFFGLLVGVLACLLVERLDTRIHTPEDVAALLRLPTFGVVPDFRRLPANGNGGPPATTGSSNGRDLVTLLHPASIVSEAYRSIRTNVLFSSPGSPPKTILVTSSQAGEGKTVTTVNLAVSLALSGSRVLIVDADLRKPGCHRQMRVVREPGLSSVLTGQCDLPEALVLSPLFSNGNGQALSASAVYVLPAGASPPNPAELLGSRLMTQLLDTLKEQFDFVLIDSPPVLPVTDSVVMATKTDGVLLVVKGGEWGRDVVQKALGHLDAVRSHVLGVVLNCVDVTRGGSPYYYYRHYYGGYYGKRRTEDEHPT